MRSKTSFFNRTLYQKNLSRFWPLWALPSFVGALVPMTMLMQMFRMHDFHTEPMRMMGAYYSALHGAVPVLSLLYAVLCAAAVWSYLYNSRSVGMMHRLPIRREGLFVTGFLSGMTMMLIPYAITGALTIAVTVAMGGVPVKAMLLTVLGVLLESFFYFSSATFVVFLTGNVFAMPVLYFLLHFLEPVLDMLLGVLISGFYYGVEGGYSGLLEFLCPTVYLIDKTNVQYIYDEVLDPVSQSVYHDLTAVEFQNFWVIGAYALAGVVLLALAYLFYRRRSSERAGEVAAVGWMRPVFRYSGALLAGLGGGLLLYTLVWRPFQASYDELEIIPLTICMIVMGLMGYYAVSMLLEKSLRVFRGSLPGVAVVTVALCLICAAFQFDIFGVERYVPKADQIQSVHISADASDINLESGRNDALIEKTLEMHQALVDDIAYVEQGVDAIHYNYDNRTVFMYLRYELKDGRSVRRGYEMRLTRERMAQEGTYDYLLDQLVNDPETLKVRLHGDETNLAMQSADLTDHSEAGYQSLNATQAQQIYKALLLDAQNGNWGRTLWFEDEDLLQEILATGENPYQEGPVDKEEIRQMLEQLEQQGESFADLTLWYRVTDEEDSANSLNIRVRPSMSETIACLRKLGALEKDRLAVIPMQEPSDVVAYEVESFEIPLDPSDPAIEMIGGVDGPSRVYAAEG